MKIEEDYIKLRVAAKLKSDYLLNDDDAFNNNVDEPLQINEEFLKDVSKKLSYKYSWKYIKNYMEQKYYVLK